MNVPRRYRLLPARTILALLSIALAAPLIAGCGSTVPVAPVHGVVTLDGKPLAFGAVVFTPLAEGDNKQVGKPAYGEIDPDGTFTLGTFGDADGALVGVHRATIMGDTNSDDGPPPGTTETRAARAAKPPFKMVRVTDRTFDVVAGAENQFTIELSSDHVRRFARRDD